MALQQRRILYPDGGMRLLLLAFSFVAALSAAGRPNLILIMADDMGFETLSPYGGTSYETPVFDRLAREGVRFTHVYSQPICTPSRNKMMTGRANRRNYISFGTLLRGETTFAHVLGKAGYKTGVVGKWQLTGDHPNWTTRGKGATPEQAGFDEYCLWAYRHNMTAKQTARYASESGFKGKTSRFWAPAVRINGEYRPTSRDDYGPDVYSDYALDFIERHQDERFFLYYPMALTHSPFVATPHSTEINDKTKFKSDDRYFKDMVEYTDYLVGRIVDKVDQLGLAEDTLILFTGDNGSGRGLKSMLGDRVVIGGKGTPKDSGNHVALLVRWKGAAPAGEVNDDLLDFSDFLPTLAEAADAPLPSNVEIDGRSFLTQIFGETGAPREYILMDYDRDPDKPTGPFPPVRFARTKRFKLYSDGRFFDIPQDWEEERPIAQGSAGVLGERIRKKLAAALAKVPTWKKPDGTQHP